MVTSTEHLSSKNIKEEINELQALYHSQKQASNQTLHHVLSTLQNVKHTLLSALTSVPAHPYEKFKKEFIDPETKPMLIEDICCPDDFCFKTCSNEICAISVELNQDWDQQICMLSCCDIVEQPNICNAFASLSEGTFVVDKQRASKHLQFVEMIKNIPIQLIEQQPYEVAKKLASQFVNVYKK